MILQRITGMLMFIYPGENRDTLRSQYEFLCFYVWIRFPPEEKSAVVIKLCVFQCVHLCIPLCVCSWKLIVIFCVWQNTAALFKQITEFQLRSVCMCVHMLNIMQLFFLFFLVYLSCSLKFCCITCMIHISYS